MAQGDDFQEQVQAMRPVAVNLPLNAVLPATPGEIFHVHTQLDPETQKVVVLWEDIQQAFRNVVQVRNKTRIVPFLKGKDLRTLEPRRIAAVPNIILDVVVDDPLMDKGFTSPQVQQLALQSVPRQNDDSRIKVEVASRDGISTPIARPSPSTTSTLTVTSTATSTVRRNQVYGLVETAMENYSHIDRPPTFPSARGPQSAQYDLTYTVNDLSVPSHPNSSYKVQHRAPQSATTSLSVEMQWARAIISASEGDKDAQVALGDMYRDGNGVAQDYQTAMDWYFKAVKQGDAAGQQRVGGLYDEGLGVPQDFSIAMDWYLKADEQGYAVAQHSIGCLYKNGEGVPQDYAQAMDWYLKAANQGLAAAQLSIGYIYDQGHGVPQDYAQATDWYLKAANQGNASAQNNLGFLYQEGRGVPRDYIQAMDWYLKAANQGNAFAQYNIAHLYRHGNGVPQDRSKAVEWYQKAADQGDADAKYALKTLSEEQVVT